LDGKISRSADDLVDIRKDLLLEISDTSALAADQMIVRFCFCLVAVERAAGVYFLCQPLVDKDRQVSVDGSEAEARKFRFQSVIEPGCRGMTSGRVKYHQKPFPLAAVAVWFFRTFLFH